MTDWYQMMAAARPKRRFLTGQDYRADVRRQGDAADFARESAPGPSAPQWAEALNRRRAQREMAATPRERAGTGSNRWRGAIRGGVMADVVVPDLEAVPFGLVAGTDDAPAGDDFAAWYRQVTAPRSRLFMREESAPVDAPAPLPSRGAPPATGEGGVGEAYAGGPRRLGAPLRQGDGDSLSATEYFSLSPERQRQASGEVVYDTRSGIQPDFDPTEAWAEAELRAEQRARQGAPNAYDALFRLVFGQRGGPQAQAERDAQSLLDEVRNRGGGDTTQPQYLED